MMEKLKRTFTLWRLLYCATAVATFRHSAIGFATLEHDNLFLGALGAIAVDLGMLLAAETLRQRRSGWLILGLAVASCTSAYSQILFGVTNAEAVVISDGALWMQGFARTVIDWRVVIFPVLLPLLTVIYAFASKEAQVAAEPVTTPGPDNALAVVHWQERPATKREQCKALALENPTASPSEIAERVGCAVSTASRAIGSNGRKEVIDELAR